MGRPAIRETWRDDRSRPLPIAASRAFGTVSALLTALPQPYFARTPGDPPVAGALVAATP
jgi:hypothetical protein